MGAKVLVTGSNGHVGSNLVRHLVEHGYRVRASVRGVKDPEKTRPLAGLDVELVEADIMKPETLERAVEGVEGVFHVAAVFAMVAKDPEKEIIAPAVQGGLNVLRAAKKAGVRRVVVTSSCAAIGIDATPEKPLTEEDWYGGALTPYMVAKTEAEKQAWQFAKENQLDLVTICPTGIIGPGFFRHTPMTSTFEQVVRGKLPAVPPFAFSYVDVRDVAAGHRLAFEKPSASGRYIVSKKFLTMLELMAAIKAAAPELKVPNREIPDFVLPIVPAFDWITHKLTGAPRQIDSDVIKEYRGTKQHVSSAKIERELGWTTRPFEQSVADTITWVREHFVDKKEARS